MEVDSNGNMEGSGVIIARENVSESGVAFHSFTSSLMTIHISVPGATSWALFVMHSSGSLCSFSFRADIILV